MASPSPAKCCLSSFSPPRWLSFACPSPPYFLPCSRPFPCRSFFLFSNVDVVSFIEMAEDCLALPLVLAPARKVPSLGGISPWIPLMAMLGWGPGREIGKVLGISIVVKGGAPTAVPKGGAECPGGRPEGFGRNLFFIISSKKPRGTPAIPYTSTSMLSRPLLPQEFSRARCDALSGTDLQASDTTEPSCGIPHI